MSDDLFKITIIDQSRGQCTQVHFIVRSNIRTLNHARTAKIVCERTNAQINTIYITHMAVCNQMPSQYRFSYFSFSENCIEQWMFGNGITATIRQQINFHAQHVIALSRSARSNRIIILRRKLIPPPSSSSVVANPSTHYYTFAVEYEIKRLLLLMLAFIEMEKMPLGNNTSANQNASRALCAVTYWTTIRKYARTDETTEEKKKRENRKHSFLFGLVFTLFGHTLFLMTHADTVSDKEKRRSEQRAAAKKWSRQFQCDTSPYAIRFGWMRDECKKKRKEKKTFLNFIESNARFCNYHWSVASFEYTHQIQTAEDGGVERGRRRRKLNIYSNNGPRLCEITRDSFDSIPLNQLSWPVGWDQIRIQTIISSYWASAIKRFVPGFTMRRTITSHEIIQICPMISQSHLCWHTDDARQSIAFAWT